MKIKNPESRLNKFWGKVDDKHIFIISNFLIGKDILDMGCGNGTTTNYIANLGFNCIGIDYDTNVIDYCKDRFPENHFQVANAEQLPFKDGSFDTIILRDALHHFYCEADFEKVKAEILRVSRQNARIIFFDPNIGPLIKFMRKIVGHTDEECDFESAKKIIIAMGLKKIHHSFNTVFSLPLSGGYVGFNFVPNYNIIYDFILKSEKIFEIIINKIGLGRYLCWRYLIIGEK